MTITIRPAVETDQPTIVSFIQQAKLNPINLHWERFLIAEENGKIVGIRQVKIYEHGTREVDLDLSSRNTADRASARS